MSLHTISTKERWEVLTKQIPDLHPSKDLLYDKVTEEQDTKDTFGQNIENFIGTVKIPVGVAGPLRVKGSTADRSYFIPVATTEAALVASISRGCKLLNSAGGVTSRVVDQRVSRAPVFVFNNLEYALRFYEWSLEQTDKFRMLAASTTRHGKLVEITPFLEGNTVHLKFDYFTGNASGQNMATFATKKIFDYIKKEVTGGLSYCALEGGRSSDKKGSATILQNTRGRKVVTEAIIPKDVLFSVMRTTPEILCKQRQINALAHAGIGQIGTVMGNVANVLAAVYIACGQDPACVVEGHVGLSRFNVTQEGDLYCAMTLPGILVASIGGGTALPSQNACLSLLGCKSANELAEVVAAACLAGELSITSSFCTDEFAKAHFSLARTTSVSKL